MAAYIDPSNRLDWLTPAFVRDDWVLPLLGAIDFAPCGNPASLIGAVEQSLGESEDDDGMRHAWHRKGEGRIFLNPTFGERLPKPKEDKPPPPEMPFFHPLSQWILKCHVEWQRGATIFAVLPAGTDKGWFHRYVTQTAFCLLEKRIPFRLPEMPSDQKSQPGNAHMIALWEHNKNQRERFFDLMDPLGFCSEPS